MKYPARVATVIAAAAMVALPQAGALAQMQTYYHAGAWDAFSGRNDKGGATCGIGTTMPDDRRMVVEFDIGGTDTTLSVSKPAWAIPDNTRIVVVMQIGLNTPWTQQGTGHEHVIDWPMDPPAMRAFDQQFRGAASMTLTFPDGNEPPWSISLAGSTAISDTLGRCIRDLTRQVQATQPPPPNAPPPQAGPTQPFSAPADTQPPR
jgi:hypothetical protein